MYRALAISSLLFGLLTLWLILAYALRRGLRRNRVLGSVVLFGVLGFLIPFAFSVVAFVRNNDSALYAGWLWPTSIMLMAGERGDPASSIVIVFGMAVLANVGVYGFVGFVLGSIWNWARSGPQG